LPEPRAWTGFCRKAQYRTNKTKKWHRGLGQEDLDRFKHTIGIIMNYKDRQDYLQDKGGRQDYTGSKFVRF
jgi:hypothetical protein